MYHKRVITRGADDWGDGFAGAPVVASLGDAHVEVWAIQAGELAHKWHANGQWSDWAMF